MEKKTCHYCKGENNDISSGICDEDVDEFYCYNCVEHCSVCNKMSPQDESFHCDYVDNGTTCNKAFHNHCGVEDKNLGWLCGDHDKYAV